MKVPFHFSEIVRTYVLQNGTQMFRKNDDDHCFKVVYASGDTIYFNSDGSVNYVVDSGGKAWW